jgi:cation-transporting ATPase 13A1
MTVSEDVESISLLVRRPVWLHYYIAPFIAIYALWFYAAIAWLGFPEHVELTFISLAVIGILQLLMSLACFWSVHINCAFTCRKEGDVYMATHVKVIPTPNNGFPELVPLKNSPDDTETGEIWFTFQKMKYIYNADEKKQFRSIDFPVNESMGFYQSWKGYQTEEELTQAQKKFGKNRFVSCLAKTDSRP